MIMGRGTATTDAEIIAEYRQFVINYRHIQGESTLAGLLAVPTTLCKRIGGSATQAVTSRKVEYNPGERDSGSVPAFDRLGTPMLQ